MFGVFTEVCGQRGKGEISINLFFSNSSEVSSLFISGVPFILLGSRVTPEKGVTLYQSGLKDGSSMATLPEESSSVQMV